MKIRHLDEAEVFGKRIKRGDWYYRMELVNKVIKGSGVIHDNGGKLMN